VLGKGVDPPPLAVPDPGQTYSGILDPQGNPFFFNGQQKFKYNEAVFGPVGDKVVDDTGTHSSGAFAPSEQGPGSYKLTFKRKGTYQVLCLLHPGMKQTVTVLKKKAKGADKPAKVRSKVAKQAAKLYKAAQTAADQAVPANTVYAGVESKQATLLAFAPKTLTVPAGTTVTFALKAPSEVHNMVWGPTGETGFTTTFAAQTDLLPLGPGAPNQVSPPFLYGSEPAPGGVYTYTGQNYGNGFLFTPLMDDAPGDPPAGLPGTTQVKFTTPGTYSYYCQIHGDAMSGTVVVQ